MQSLIANAGLDFSQYFDSNAIDVSQSSDVATRYITNTTAKKYLEIFNSSTLGDMRTYVHNAGRYNQGGSKVNVDIPPFIVSVLDELNAQILKNTNSQFQQDITDLVANGLSRNIEIPTRI